MTQQNKHTPPTEGLAPCPECGSPCRIEWSGLELVENTGDETLATKHYRPVGDTYISAYWKDQNAALLAEVEALKAERESQDNHLRDLTFRIVNLRDALAIENMKLAACGVIALCNTRESAAENRNMHKDYISDSLDHVMKAVDREMDLRDENARLKASERELYEAALNLKIEYTNMVIRYMMIEKYPKEQIKAHIENDEALVKMKAALSKYENK